MIAIYTAFHKEFTKTYRFDVAYAEEEVHTIIWTGIYIYFVQIRLTLLAIRPDHIIAIYYMWLHKDSM